MITSSTHNLNSLLNHSKDNNNTSNERDNNKPGTSNNNNKETSSGVTTTEDKATTSNENNDKDISMKDDTSTSASVDQEESKAFSAGSASASAIGNGTQPPPRKRSKVSRACDECRRKKIKCDATIDSLTNNIKVQCSNCAKTNEFCAFTRIPLKRGPTKGYIREMEVGGNSNGGTVKDTEHHHRRNSSSSSSMLSQHVPSISSLRRESFTHHLPPLPTSNTTTSVPTTTTTATTSTAAQKPKLSTGSTPGPGPGPASTTQIPIVLPPIDHNRSRASSNLTLSPRSSVPSILQSSGPGPISGPGQGLPGQSNQSYSMIQAPSASSLMSNNNINNNNTTTSSTAGQGHFWKVPYEYSAFNNDRRGSADSLTSSISDSFSAPFYGSSGNSKPTAAGTKARIDSTSVVSDSDDEVYPNSNNNNGSGSRYRKSSLRSPLVSSASSATAHTATHTSQSQSQPITRTTTAPTEPGPGPGPIKARSPDSLSISSVSTLNNKLNFGLNFQNQHLKSPIDLKALENNIMLYYTNYHKNIYALPLNSNNFLNSINDLELSSEVGIFIVDLFNSSLLLLNNSNKSSQAFVDDIRLVFQQIVKTFPIFNKEISCNEFWKLLFLSTLIILNYCIVLSGQDFSIALNVIIAIFNDFKIDRVYKELLLTSSETQLDYDDLVVIYSRLFFNLVTFDQIYSSSFKKNGSINGAVQFFDERAIQKLLPEQDRPLFCYQFMLISSFDAAQGQGSRSERTSAIDDLKTCVTKGINSQFQDDVILCSWKDFIEVYDLIKAMMNNNNNNSNTPDYDYEEYIFDNFFKIIQMVKKLTIQLNNIFENFYESTNTKKNLTIYSSMILSISFKILLSLRNLIQSMIKFQKKIGNHDFISRLQKTEFELNNIFYQVFKSLNFENLNCSGNLNMINQRFSKGVHMYAGTGTGVVSGTTTTNNNNKSHDQINEWLKYLDANVINLIDDVDEYGWLI